MSSRCTSRGAYGYFWGETWRERDGQKLTDEIALNPEMFPTQTTADVLSTLVHEMCHLQQHHFGAPSRAGYHNKEWAQMISAVGLVPSDTGQPGGKPTGQRMSHYIERGGRFARACAQLLERGFSIPWQALPRDAGAARTKAASKTKYTCPGCGLNAWAKPDVPLVCGACDKALERAG